MVRLTDGSELTARAVVIATGIEGRRLGVTRLEELVGAGVFYGAAVSESRAMRGQDVFIVGAGNSAGQAALHLGKHAREVTLVVRGDGPRQVDVELSDRPDRGGGEHSRPVSHRGGRRQRRRASCRTITLADRANGSAEHRGAAAAALFIMIGGDPHTQWLDGQLARDPQGYLVTGRDVLDHPAATWDGDNEPLPLETSMPGVFAAGDVRQDSIKRVASAVGDGATVVRLVHEYLRAHQPRAHCRVGSPSI